LKDELTEEAVSSTKMVVIAGTNSALGVNEVNILKNYLENQGGSVLVLAESCSASHYYNAFTQNFGISIVKGKINNSD